MTGPFQGGCACGRIPQRMAITSPLLSARPMSIARHRRRMPYPNIAVAARQRQLSHRCGHSTLHGRSNVRSLPIGARGIVRIISLPMPF
jgi:hypothetical protein